MTLPLSLPFDGGQLCGTHEDGMYVKGKEGLRCLLCI